MSSAFEVRDGSIQGPDGMVLHDLSFSIPWRGVTAVLGPAGCGKSLLLDGLHGSLPPAGWRRRGRWECRAGTIVHLPQRCVDAVDWRTAVERPGDALLVDEIERAVDEADRDELADRLRRRGTAGAVVLVTHNLAFARAVADQVVLVCDGTIVEQGDARSFFEAPRHPLARRFVVQGNCWPAAPALELPSHFRWLLPNQLAGMGRPGLLRDEEDDLYAIASRGISLLVSLTERPFPPERLRPFGIDARHFPIADMGVPPRGATERLCRAIEKTIEQGHAVAVHCLAGRGRTGTMLAAFLVWKGVRANEAVARVRATIDGAIQTPGQLAFIRELEELP